MKKRTFSNLIMVLIILAVAAGGVSLALYLRQTPEADLGSQYRGTEPGGLSLIEDNQPGRCTITIRCDTILSHRDDLAEGKLPYVPADGVILATSTVSFAQGDTVFDVLQRVCTAADIQLEYSWTPLYDSYYVEGIAHLYEFDCGAESGWMYRVNDQFPNYGCSSYTLQGGEDILWCYTCTGLGEDVGSPGVGDGQ